MINWELYRYAAWSAFLSAIMTILGLVTLMVFFALGEPWGTLNDITSVILALSILPVLLILHRLHRNAAQTISLVALVIGGIAMLVAAVFQTLLILKVIAFAQTAVVVPATFGVLGASLMIYGYLARTNQSLPPRLALVSMIAGVGYVLVILGIIIGGQEHPLAAIGGLTAVICYPICAIWMGRLLLAGALTQDAG